MKSRWKKFLAASCVIALLCASPGMTVYGEDPAAGAGNEPVTSVQTVGNEPVTSVVQTAGSAENPDYMTDKDETESADVAEQAIPEESSIQVYGTGAAGDFDDGTGETADAVVPEAETVFAAKAADVSEEYLSEEGAASDADEPIGVDAFLAEGLSVGKNSGPDDIPVVVETIPEGEEDSVGYMTFYVEDWPVGTNVYASVSTYPVVRPDGPSGLIVTLMPGSANGGTLGDDWIKRLERAPSLPANWRSDVISMQIGSQNGGTLFLPENSRELFSEFPKLDSLVFYNVNTSRVTVMDAMFRNDVALTSLSLDGFNTSKTETMGSMFEGCSGLTILNLENFDTKNVYNMSGMFSGCSSLTSLNVGNFNTSKVSMADEMFRDCKKLTKLDVSGFTLNHPFMIGGMFKNCSALKELDLSGFDLETTYSMASLVGGCSALEVLKTPAVNVTADALPKTMYDTNGKSYKALPVSRKSIILKDKPFGSIANTTIAGISLSYGYSGKPYTPSFTVKKGDAELVSGRDYTYKFQNNTNPGTASLIITGKGNLTGTKIKTFEIVDCVSNIVSGKTYQLIPKNNSKTAVCSYSGKMVNNTKVYITDRSSSEAMKFVAKKNADGSWKFINAKCELALAVQQNSTAVGAGLVLYDQTTKKAQNWNLSRKSDNSFAIINAVTGYSIAMSDASAVKGTTLSMQETASSGLQRFYFAETTPVSTSYDGMISVRASANKKFALNINNSSKSEGANVNIYTYGNTNAQKFRVMYSGGGYYRFVSVNSGMVLTVNGNSSEDGANVIQRKWIAANGQRWKFMKNSDGTITFRNVNGTVLHISGNKMANGSNVVAKKHGTTKAQRWVLAKA